MGQAQEEQLFARAKYLRAMVSQYETTIQAVHSAARTHTQRSKGTVGPAVDYRPQGEALPVISADLTSELLHCLSTLPDPWPLAKITIDMEKPSQWVSKLCRLYFADEYAKRTVGLPSRRHVPDIAGALRAVQAILPKLEVKMIEFLAEWMVTLLMPASHVLEVRAPHLSFMMLKEYWFRELYLGLKVTASFDRSESYTRVIDGQVRCITPEVKPQNLQVIWNVQFITVFVPAWMIPPVYHSLRRESIKTTSSASPIGVQSVRPTWFEDTTPRDTTWIQFFLWSAPVAFRRVALETPDWTNRDSNHHRQSVSAGKTNAIPTEPSGRLHDTASAPGLKQESLGVIVPAVPGTLHPSNLKTLRLKRATPATAWAEVSHQRRGATSD